MNRPLDAQAVVYIPDEAGTDIQCFAGPGGSAGIAAGGEPLRSARCKCLDIAQEYAAIGMDKNAITVELRDVRVGRKLLRNDK